jgi:hypothetical protein
VPWYTARMLLEVGVAHGRGRRAARAVLVLVRAETAGEAWSRAEELGLRYERARTSASPPSKTIRFAGVQHITACSRAAGDPGEVEILGPGVELFSTDCEID